MALILVNGGATRIIVDVPRQQPCLRSCAGGFIELASGAVPAAGPASFASAAPLSRALRRWTLNTAQLSGRQGHRGGCSAEGERFTLKVERCKSAAELQSTLEKYAT